MAATALVSVAGGIINNVAVPLATEQFRLYRGLEKEVKRLEGMVTAIKAVLEDAEAKQGQSRAVSLWIERLTDILYEADDLLDTVFSEALRPEGMSQGKKVKKVRIFLSKSKKFFDDLKIVQKIKNIRQKLDHISSEKEKFHFEEYHVEKRVRVRDTYSHLGGKEIIGREDDKKAVIQRLEANVETNVSIFSIVGIGGLGKTALAQLIYNDHNFNTKFHLKMWVCVSNDFDVEIIARKILGCLTREKPRDETMNALVDLLSRKMNGQSYLLILDDVWNQDSEKWCQLKDLLGNDSKGSRIIVTTRSTRVAQVMRSKPYILRGLGEEASWKLFKQQAFENEQESIDTIKREIGMEIVKKCAGVPLALRSVGGMLYSKDLESWMAFKDKELSTISPDDETNNIMPTLKLSYNRLLSRLKKCFAYCCLFSKDFVYEKITLINLWIAQGFVEPRKDQCLEDTGHEYFINLLFGSFFQEPKMDNLGNIIECKMHDLMHDLAISVAGSLIATIGDEVRNISNKTRFVSFNDDIDFSSLNHFLFEVNNIRTLICPIHNFLTRPENFKHIDCEAIFLLFENLRVLDLKNRELKCLPNSIGKLKQLRYLDISNNFFNQLPPSIMLLQNLRTLKLYNCVQLEKLPSGIAKLINLRNLNLDGCYNLRYIPQGLGKLINLHRLTFFVVNKGPFSNDSSSLNELNGLDNLRGSLKIHGLRHERVVEYEATNLKEKSRLSRLTLLWCDRNFDSGLLNDMSFNGLQPSPSLKNLVLVHYQFSELQSWISSLTSLVILDLRCCHRCQYLSPLSQLPLLKNITLKKMDDLEYISKYDDTRKLSSFSSLSSSSLVFFPMLETLTISSCPKLKGLWKGDSSTEAESNGTITKVTSLEKHNPLPPPHGRLLDVEHCPMWSSPSICPNLEDLTLRGTPHATLILSTVPLANLKSLRLENIPQLKTLPEEVVQNLTSLQKLTLFGLWHLKFAYPIQHLTKLKHLDIDSCDRLELDYGENGMQCQNAPSLQTLNISFWDCLTSIPKWIENCKTLEVLKIFNCPNFNSQRCKKETGEDSPKIAHIPNIIVKNCMGSAIEEFEATEQVSYGF